MLERLWSDGSWILLAVYTLLFLGAVAKGGAPERICAGLLLVIVVVDRFHQQTVGSSLVYRGVDLGTMLVDIAQFCALLAVALHANRIYPLWLGAAQIIAVIAHFYRMSFPDIERFAYEEMQAMPSYIQMAAMSLGLGFHVARQKRLGRYPSWRRPAASTGGAA